MLQQLLNHLALAEEGKRLITIDGPAGSGKTTLSDQLAGLIKSRGISVEIVHLDDVYDGWEKALTSSLSDNLREITTGFLQGEVTYKTFDWSLSRFTSTKTFSSPRVLIVEGVGSGQSAIRERVDLAIWIEVDATLAFERVINRDGEEIRPQMEQWVIAQNEHFLQEKTRSAADYQLHGAP